MLAVKGNPLTDLPALRRVEAVYAAGDRVGYFSGINR
jgi:hypothetical protein